MRALASLCVVCLTAFGSACGGDPPAPAKPTPEATGADAAAPTSMPAASGDQATGTPAADPQPTGNATAAAPEPVDAGPAPEPLPDKPVPASVEEAPTPTDAAQLKRSGDLGRDVAEAMRTGKGEALLELTPYGSGDWAKACPPDNQSEGKREALARIKHCLKVIPWDSASDIRVAGGKSTGNAAPGCSADINGFESITMLVVTPRGSFEAKLRGVAGRGDKAESYSGVISCGPRGG